MLKPTSSYIFVIFIDFIIMLSFLFCSENKHDDTPKIAEGRMNDVSGLWPKKTFFFNRSNYIK